MQPVVGEVFLAESGEPLAGAQLVNAADPKITASPDEHGQFLVEGVSEMAVHVIMPGSYLDRQFWLITHPDYPTAVAVTRTLGPPIWEQVSRIRVSIFEEMADSPPSCPYGQYLITLGNWYLADPSRDPEHSFWDLMDAGNCADPDIMAELDELANAMANQPDTSWPRPSFN